MGAWQSYSVPTRGLQGQSLSCFHYTIGLYINADDGTRTHKVYYRQILSLLRLPVSPHPHKSEWWDSNPRLPHPKCGALPTEPHPDICGLSHRQPSNSDLPNIRMRNIGGQAALMLVEGLEPSISYERQILSLLSIPFDHTSV